MANFFISDTHFNHWDAVQERGIITFERTQFPNIMAHDAYLCQIYNQIAKKLKPNDVLWHLGDFGDLSFLWTCQIIKDTGATINLVLGNHDKQADIPEFEKYFDNVYEYPIWLSKKLVISHEPVAVWDSQINVHGHIHSAIIDKPNYINANIHINKYAPITEKRISSVFAKIPKYNMRFLYEPFAQWYKFIQDKEDVIMNYDGKIDLSASRVLQRINTQNRKNSNDSYQPYTGSFI